VFRDECCVGGWLDFFLWSGCRKKRVGFCSMTILNDRTGIEEVTEGSVSFNPEKTVGARRKGHRRGLRCRTIGPISILVPLVRLGRDK